MLYGESLQGCSLVDESGGAVHWGAFSGLVLGHSAMVGLGYLATIASA